MLRLPFTVADRLACALRRDLVSRTESRGPCHRLRGTKGPILLRAVRNRAVLVTACAVTDQLAAGLGELPAFSVTIVSRRGLAAEDGLPGDGRQAEEDPPRRRPHSLKDSSGGWRRLQAPAAVAQLDPIGLPPMLPRHAISRSPRSDPPLLT